MGSVFSSIKKSKEHIEMALNKGKEIVIFSKTYCGYCKRVKQLTQLGASSRVIELQKGKSLVCSLSDQIESREMEFKEKFEMEFKKHTDKVASNVAAVIQRAKE